MVSANMNILLDVRYTTYEEGTNKEPLSITVDMFLKTTSPYFRKTVDKFKTVGLYFGCRTPLNK
jgi:hypothetical protein